MVLIVTDICYVSVYSYNFTYVVIHITIYIIHFWVKNIFSKKFDCQSTIYFILKSSSSFIKIQYTVLHMYNNYIVQRLSVRTNIIMIKHWLKSDFKHYHKSLIISYIFFRWIWRLFSTVPILTNTEDHIHGKGKFE